MSCEADPLRKNSLCLTLSSLKLDSLTNEGKVR